MKSIPVSAFFSSNLGGLSEESGGKPFGQSMKIEAQPTFVACDVASKKFGVEFYLDVKGGRLQYHFWPSKTGRFPRNFGTSLRNWIGAEAVVDYVPEVGSWYVERPVANPYTVQQDFITSGVEVLDKLVADGR